MFVAILKDSHDNQSIPGLQDLSYSHNVPENGGTGCVYGSGKTSETTVAGWLFDYRTIPGNMRWTPVEPGQNGVWRHHNSIRAIFASCEDGGRQFEHWIKARVRRVAWRAWGFMRGVKATLREGGFVPALRRCGSAGSVKEAFSRRESGVSSRA